ncbi:SagB-type dehydrogenase family enzyme [Allocatelliglobosispora scoriae]|uniref:SagB-type dehydrogenase family enzyme n=1 Tax=Allocatelliglobosispora scoriae TaxID=643052 RepID=A0A841BKD5_9ACTN|nr:SagB/ThcOx family dehydrogenase [Allocatelliglobosispora scoriae]MBB5867341.1 SagB-type dehydrogenase family enzyme [Allocatelliglobosispora scoriae]
MIDAEVIKVFSGSGSDRENLEFTDQALLTWLLSCTDGADPASLAQALAGHLGTDATEAYKMVEFFIENGVLVTTATSARYRVKGEPWERRGWRDAFDFHAATTGLRFEKLWGSDYARELFESYVADPTFGPQPTIFKDTPPGQGQSLGDGVAWDPLPVSAVLERRTIADGPAAATVGMDAVASLLSHAFATQRTMEIMVLGPHQQRSYPSGGARHPLELYVGVRRVPGIEAGVYHYDPLSKELTRVAGSDAAEQLDAAAPQAVSAPVVLFMTSRWIRHLWKYRYARSYRMVLMEAGHAAQSLRMAGAALGLDVVSTAQVAETAITRLLGLEDQWDESPLYVLAVNGGRDR